jgi:ubiquinol-cytochrome c reductase iron-sulfur subunit
MSEEPTPGTGLVLLLAAGWELARSLARGATNLLLAKPASTEAKAQAASAAAHYGPPYNMRDADIPLGKSVEGPQTGASILVVFAFLVGIAAGTGFLYVYWSSASDWLLGVTLTLCFGGIGSALVFWAHLLVAHKEAIEERPPMISSPEDRQAVFVEFIDGKTDVRRRGFLTWLSAATIGLFAAIFISGFRSFGTPPGPSLFDTIWKRGQRLVKEDGSPVSVDSLVPGSTVIVFPEGSIGDEKAQTVLIRVDEAFLQIPKEHADWAPMGYLAYSRVCTHAGCPVGLYQKQAHLLLCPCHQSSFDVLQGAMPTGGPAPRPLPQLPLYVEADGTLRAAGPFTAPPGPGFWGWTS